MDRSVINALVRYNIIETMAEKGPLEERLVDQAAIILRQKIAMMPLLLKTALTMMTFCFDWSGILFSGRPFHRQSLDQQRKMVAIYQGSFLKVFSELFRFYKKMSIFIYFSLCPTQI